MVRLCGVAQWQQGVALVVALLMLSMLSLLVLTAFSSSLLASKISVNNQRYVIAFENAELALNLGKCALQKKTVLKSGGGVDARYVIAPFSGKTCPGKSCYTVTATGYQGVASMVLQADYSLCTVQSRTTVHRFAWRQLVTEQ